jgi:hypothetical protein
LIFAFVPATMPKTRFANAYPDREEHLTMAELGGHIPCFYGTYPKVSITATLLTGMLKYLDKNGAYD